jgi:hypothetical protein
MGFREMRVPFGSRIFLQNFPFAEKHKDEILFVCLGLIHLSFHKERERPLIMDIRPAIFNPPES